MEYLDIYDENACKTGKTIIRGTPVRQGEYSMAVHLYIYNAKGEFLIQKRSKNKKSLPGIWSENSLQAGIREAEEELGLRLVPEQLQMVSRIKRRRSFIDIYFVEEDFSIDRCVLQEEEVEDVRLCGGRELLAIIGSSERVNSSYTAAVERAMKKRGLL